MAATAARTTTLVARLLPENGARAPAGRRVEKACILVRPLLLLLFCVVFLVLSVRVSGACSNRCTLSPSDDAIQTMGRLWCRGQWDSHLRERLRVDWRAGAAAAAGDAVAMHRTDGRPRRSPARPEQAAGRSRASNTRAWVATSLASSACHPTCHRQQALPGSQEWCRVLGSCGAAVPVRASDNALACVLPAPGAHISCPSAPFERDRILLSIPSFLQQQLSAAERVSPPDQRHHERATAGRAALAAPAAAGVV